MTRSLRYSSLSVHKPPKRMLETEWRLRNETSSYTCFPSLGCLVTLHCLEAISTGIPGLPPQCAYLCKQSTFCQLWCRRAHDKQLKKQALSKHRPYCTPRDPTSRLFQWKISQFSFKHMALQFTTNSQSDTISSSGAHRCTYLQYYASASWNPMPVVLA